MDSSIKTTNFSVEVTDAESDSASSFISVRSALSVRSAENQSRFFRKRPRADAKGPSAESSSGEEAVSAPKVSTRKRGGGGNLGSGRPAQVKTVRAAGPAKEAQHTGVAPGEAGSSRLSESSAEEGDSGAALMKRYSGFLGLVGAVVKAAATKKKAFLRQQVLERAAGQIVAAAKTSFGGPSSKELAKLGEEVARLTAEVAKLRRENEELRAGLAGSRESRNPQPPSPPTPMAQPRAQPVARPAEKPARQPAAQPAAQSKAQPVAHGDGQQSERRDLAELLRQEMAALMAKFSAIEGRLLRPPLAGDRKEGSYATVAAAAKPGTSGQKAPVQTPTRNAPKQGAMAGRGPKQVAPPAPTKVVAPAQTKGAKAAPTQTKGVAQKAPEEEGWEVVGAKAQKGKAARKRAQKARRAAKKAAARLQAPRSAAVVITLQPGAEEKGVTYRDVISKAKAGMAGLEEVGITGGLRVKSTRTGARLLEVPGATSGPKADALAERLRATLDADVVRVTRPTKCVDLRVLGLDDSVTSEEVATAVARVGGCEVDQVKPGPVRFGPSGLGTAVVSCPVAAANKVVGGRRLLVGWVSAQIKLLDPRPLRCFRCLTGNHVGAKCPSEAVRVDRCFRCGQPGHKAGSCSADPHCPICAGAGKPADHRAGGKACAAPTKSKGKGKGKPKGSPTTAAADAAADDSAGPPPPPSQEMREEAMES